MNESITPGTTVRIGNGSSLWHVWYVRDGKAGLSTNHGKSTRNGQPVGTLTVVHSA